MNELLDALKAHTATEGKNKYSVSLQINTHYDTTGNYNFKEVKGTKAEVSKAVKKFSNEATGFIFKADVNVIYLHVSYNYSTVRTIKIDLHKRNY